MRLTKGKTIINPTWTAFSVLAVSLIIIVFASRVLYQQTVDLLTENLRERILTVSITAAASLNFEDIQELKEENDWRKPEWSRVVSQLNKIKYENKDIVFMYIFRKQGNDQKQMEFVADADSIDPYVNEGSDTSKYVDVNRDGKIESDGPDKLQWPGQPYPEAIDIPETLEAFNGPLTSRDLYTDDYGTVLTGYAPIRDLAGNTVAVLATDIKADDFFVITRQTLQPFLIFIAFLSLLISILVLVIIFTWRKYTKSLEKMNGQIIVKNQELQNLIKQRESLVHLVTHKVKGSFTRTKYIFAGILDGTFGDVNEEVKKRATQGLEFDNTGIQTIDLVLNASNLQKGSVKYEMQVVDLRAVVLKAMTDRKSQAENKGLILENNMPEGMFTVVGDVFWLKEAVNNLIENSIQYTRKGKITLGLVSENGKVRFSVKDTGIGITDEDKKGLFTEGGHGRDSIRINVDSTGYGLYSVKLIVDAHKGKVWGESEGPEKGSTFYIELDAVK